MTTILRVFPRRTSFTPTDPLVYIGDPPLWRPPADEVHVSVTFTWDVDEGQRLVTAWGQHYSTVKLGGPVIPETNARGPFTPGLYVKQGVTFTSRGCNRRCPWCLVPDWEGPLKCLPIVPGWIVQDNNLLATPRSHQAQVYQMLQTQSKHITFSGGLDTRLIDNWEAEQLSNLRIQEVFLAADTTDALSSLREAVDKLNFLKRRQLRCYVLIAFDDETIAQAEKRLRAVWDTGCLPFAQLYRPPNRQINYSQEWRNLARTWSRPAAMFAEMKGV